jgi:hypothetical protein
VISTAITTIPAVRACSRRLRVGFGGPGWGWDIAIRSY